MNDIFGPGSNVAGRVFREYEKVAEVVQSARRLGLKIVLTSGTFDLKHAGHDRYLEKAKNAFGDPERTLLVVGVDADDKVQARKHRLPVVHEEERLELLCHVRHVDIVFLKRAADEQHQLIRTVQPDILVISKTTGQFRGDASIHHSAAAAILDEGEEEKFRQWCGEVLVLDAQATTSTTARIRLLILDVTREMKQRVDMFYQDMSAFFEKFGGESA